MIDLAQLDAACRADGIADDDRKRLLAIASSLHRQRHPTMVGSAPHRRVLTGREAVERALRMCERWDAMTAGVACYFAGQVARVEPLERDVADWLEEPIGLLSADQLRMLLCGETAGHDKVWYRLDGDELVGEPWSDEDEECPF
jgi:hypothetical protein